jgi:hypothetical protein
MSPAGPYACLSDVQSVMARFKQGVLGRGRRSPKSPWSRCRTKFDVALVAVPNEIGRRQVAGPGA